MFDELVLHVRSFVELLVVIDAEWQAVLTGGSAQSADLRRKEAGGDAG